MSVVSLKELLLRQGFNKGHKDYKTERCTNDKKYDYC